MTVEVTAFFVSALITLNAATGLSPLQGWTQFIMPFQNKEHCEAFAAGNTLPLIMQLQGTIGNMLSEFHEFRCMTEQESIDANIALGHTIPERPDTGKKI
jgi:hypothetical protein